MTTSRVLWLQKKVDVLDHGFVILKDCMGDDLTTVNAARISFGREKSVFDEKDAELVQYLAEHEHTAPFRHAYMTFHVKAPLFVFRQWMKHRIASDFNEISGRYVNLEEADFYVPEIFRVQHKDNKQGSEGQIAENEKALAIYTESCKNAINQYSELLKFGVCKEQARCVLPQAMYSEVYWTVSLQAVAHFINLRTDSHAQWEIQQYAQAIKQIVSDCYPHSLGALLK